MRDLDSTKFGKITIVGAGPGDPDLITVKAVKALAQADVVYYDALVSKDLLGHARTASEHIFVGKRLGCYAYMQDQINAMIVESARKGANVVRLKGGDPFVFGRGSEEIAYAHQFGIQTEVIPGISSALAVPALQGIPMTARHKAESFWVITGTTKNHTLSKDIAIAAQSTATVVILMGMSKIEQIMHLFQQAGKDNVPVAVIQNGSTPEEKIVSGFVNDIVQKVSENEISNPAIIVIGEVVRESWECRKIYNEFSHQLESTY